MTSARPPTGQKTSLLAVVGWIVFVLLVVYGLLIGGAWAGIYLVSLRTISLILVAVALGAWFVVSWRYPDWRPNTAIWPTLVLPPVTLAVATLASTTPRLGLEYVAWAVLLVALYLLLVRVLATQTARDRIGALAAMLTLVIGILYMGQVLLRWLEWWQLVGGLAMPPLRPLYAGLSLGSPNSVAAVQVLAAVVALAGLGIANRRRRLLAAALIAVTAVVVVISASRAGWIALAGASVVTGGIWLIAAMRHGSWRQEFAARWQQRGTRMALGAIVLGGVAGFLIMAPAIVSRFLNSGDGGRPQYFTVALRMFEDAPVLGHGPGTWAVERATYTQVGEFDWYIPHAHNVYLHTLAELGLVGLLVGLLALVPVAWLLGRALRSDAPETRRWAWAGVFVLVFLAVFQLFDFHMNVPAEILLAAIPIAFIDATTDRGSGLGRLSLDASPWLGRVARAVFWLACLAAVVVLARAESVATGHGTAVTAVYTADWEAARDPAQDAAEADPDLPPYQITLGLVASAQEDWPVAAQAYAKAAQADDMPTSWLGLAQAQVAMGADRAEVVASIERAVRLGEQQPSVLFASGALYDRLGLTEDADAAYAATVVVYPSLAADSFWAEDADLQTRFPSILESAMALAPGRAWEMALMAADASRARELAADAPYGELVIDAWEGDAEALADVHGLAEAEPENAGLLSWASRLAARAGDTEQADRYQQLAVYVLTEGGELPGMEVRVDVNGWLEAVPAGSRTGYAGHYMYRRPLSRDLLPPGLPRLVFAPRDVGFDPTTP